MYKRQAKYGIPAENVLEIIIPAPLVKSTNPMKPEMDVSLNRVITSFHKAGNEFFIACGITTSFAVFSYDKPKLLAASISPLSTEFIPPLKTSDI